MASNDKKVNVVISAEDKTRAAFASASTQLDKFASSVAGLPVLGTALAGAFSAAAITSFVKDTIDSADKLNDLSQSLGINVRDLATWELAAAQSGVTIDQVGQGAKKLAVFMAENSDELKKAGITATDVNGALIQLADIVSNLPDGLEKTNLLIKVLGKNGADLAPLLNQGSAGLAEAAAKAKDYGERMAILAPKADEFNDHMAELELHSKALGINLTTLVLPGMSGFVAFLNDINAGGPRAENALAFMAEGSPLFKGLKAWHDLFNRPSPSQGFTGAKNALGLPMSDADRDKQALDDFDAATARWVKAQDARKKARALTGKDGSADKTKKVKTPAEFDPEGDLQFKLEEAQRKRTRDFLIARDNDADKAAEDKVKRLNDLLAATPTGQLEKARDEAVFLANALETGAINEQQYLEAVGVHYGTAAEKLSEMDVFAQEAAKGIQGAFADFLFDPFEGGISKMLDNFGRMLQRMAAEAAAAQLARALFGDLGKGGSFGGVLGNLAASFFGSSSGTAGSGGINNSGWAQADAMGGAYGPGGRMAFAMGGVVDRPTAFKFARGGQMADGLMGEAGPEAILPLSRGPGGKLGVRASGGGMTVINHFSTSTPTDRRTQEQIAAMAGSSIQSAMRRNR